MIYKKTNQPSPDDAEEVPCYCKQNGEEYIRAKFQVPHMERILVKQGFVLHERLSLRVLFDRANEEMQRLFQAGITDRDALYSNAAAIVDELFLSLSDCSGIRFSP